VEDGLERGERGGVGEDGARQGGAVDRAAGPDGAAEALGDGRPHPVVAGEEVVDDGVGVDRRRPGRLEPAPYRRLAGADVAGEAEAQRPAVAGAGRCGGRSGVRRGGYGQPTGP